MPALDRAIQIARTAQAKVIIPEGDDSRIAAAADRLQREGLAVPVQLSQPKAHHVKALMTARPMRDRIAARMLQRPLMQAAAMVATGEADILVAGALAPSRRVIEAASMVIGLEEGTTTPSSFFLMVLPDGREMIFADCAVTVEPDAAQLTDIARSSHLSATRLLGAGRVALLSYSTGQSGSGPSVDKVASAAELSGFPGPVQGDAALNRAIAAQKGSAGQGDANVLVFPNLDAGNIAYKLMVELAGARAYGPILQGFKRPVCDLSRGATVDDIVASTVLAIAADRMSRAS